MRSEKVYSKMQMSLLPENGGGHLHFVVYFLRII